MTLTKLGERYNLWSPSMWWSLLPNISIPLACKYLSYDLVQNGKGSCLTIMRKQIILLFAICNFSNYLVHVIKVYTLIQNPWQLPEVFKWWRFSHFNYPINTINFRSKESKLIISLPSLVWLIILVYLTF